MGNLVIRSLYYSSLSLALLLVACGQKSEDLLPSTDSEAVSENAAVIEEGASGNLYLSKSSCSPGEEVSIDYTIVGNFSSDGWVGIFTYDQKHGSEKENEKVQLSRKAIDGSGSGTLIFIAPDKPGSYDFRLHNTDWDGIEVATSAVLTVKQETAPLPILKTGKTVYAAGEQIEIEFAALPTWDKSAWIGIVPAGTAHNAKSADEVDISYRYLEKRSGKNLVWMLPAPGKAGKYELRMYNSLLGEEVATTSFTVK